MRQITYSLTSYTGGYSLTNSKSEVTQWLQILDSIRQDDLDQNVTTMSGHTANDFSEDDLKTDLAKAALDSGCQAFESQHWGEANTLFQEALQLLQELSNRQRAFCDIFVLNYRLAICAFQTQLSADAEIALVNFINQKADSNEQRILQSNATHLLSQLYIRTGRLEQARIDCENALQARRQLLSKQNNACFESTALMAHIYVLLNNRVRAKSFLALIPEGCRESAIQKVEESLGSKVQHLEYSALLTPQSTDEHTGLGITTKENTTTTAETSEDFELNNRPYSPVFSTFGAPVWSNIWSSQSPQTGAPEYKHTSHENFNDRPDHVAAHTLISPQVTKFSNVSATPKGEPLSRKDILGNIGCQPRTSIEEAVCDGDHVALVSLLHRKKSFWKPKMKKHVCPERLTALHFAALFGEVDMARRLLAADFDINAVPYGYSTSLSPLKMAIGARQVEMVEFLISQGAKPSEPDSWSTLARQVMSRAWLMKTLADSQKDSSLFVQSRMIAILKILHKQSWDINSPLGPDGTTILHQAVGFWTGSYKWDLGLRTAFTEFLCEHGANPLQGDAKGQTPYDLAQSSGYQDTLLILERNIKRREMYHEQSGPFELSG